MENNNDNFNGPLGDMLSYTKVSSIEIKKLMNKYINLNCAICQFSNYKDSKFLVIKYQEEDMKVKPLTPPKVEPIITKEIIMQIAFAVKELIQPDIDEIKNDIVGIKARLDKVEKDITEIKTDIQMLKSFHIEDIKNYKTTN